MNISPQISVVIVTPDGFTTIRSTIAYLRNQTVKDVMEIVIVAPSAQHIDMNCPELADFRWVNVVEIGKIESIAEGNAAGIHQSTAPVVALAEDHSFPAPGWAEALIAAHRQPWAAVGPAVGNANPDSRVSWADFLIGYAAWFSPAKGGIAQHLPGHNSSYKREILLDYGPDLEKILEAESVLHWNLREKGYQLYLEPAAETSHVNFGLISSWIVAQFHSGRMFAATRAHGWSIPMRLLYTGGAFLIPVVRMYRIMGRLIRSGNYHILPWGVTPTLAFGLLVSAAGEMLGYSLGRGNSKQKLRQLEFHRIRHISEKDRLVFERNKGYQEVRASATGSEDE